MTGCEMEPITKTDEERILAIYSSVREWRDEYSPQSAFAILHAPLDYRNVPLLIIGQNPGGGIDPSEELRPPARNFLFESTHRYAFTAQALFHRAGRIMHLSFAQSTDVNFFDELDTVAARQLCAEKLGEIKNILKPQRLLINGLGAAKSFLEIEGMNRIRSVKYGALSKTMFVCPHFSRRFDPPPTEWERVIKELTEFLPEQQEQELRELRSNQ